MDRKPKDLTFLTLYAVIGRKRNGEAKKHSQYSRVLLLLWGHMGKAGLGKHPVSSLLNLKNVQAEARPDL